jgi:hypothetical protein
LLQVPGEILKDLLFALLDFEQDWLCHAGVILPRMDFPRFQQDLPQIRDTSRCLKHLVVGLNHGNSSSTIPRRLMRLIASISSDQMHNRVEFLSSRA